MPATSQFIVVVNALQLHVSFTIIWLKAFDVAVIVVLSSHSISRLIRPFLLYSLTRIFAAIVFFSFFFVSLITLITLYVFLICSSNAIAVYVIFSKIFITFAACNNSSHVFLSFASCANVISSTIACLYSS